MTDGDQAQLFEDAAVRLRAAADRHRALARQQDREADLKIRAARTLRRAAQAD